MKRFKNILFVAQDVSDNKNSLAIAASLAKRNSAHITVVEVIKDLVMYLNILPGSSHAFDLEEQIVQDHIERLDHLIAPFVNKGIDISRKILKGTPFLEIIGQIIKKEHDLVIITPEGHGLLSDMIFGTTTMHLMRKCPCPVWAIRPGQSEKFSRIIAAVDFDPSNNENDALNKKIMEIASSLASMQNSELHVVHSWDFHARSVMIKKSVIDKMTADLQVMHKAWFEELLRTFVPALPPSQGHFIQGEAGVQISMLAREKQMDLIIMGTVCRTGIPGLLIGNTAEKILHRINCSVLALKPDGFISPVQVD